mmetsp:Transcript_12277/g.35315  ORF Transcript_12277/g.35315 Transcript_12277/m.35315 type:complete len:139 (-) Transcript_12277:724-1140(-)
MTTSRLSLQSTKWPRLSFMQGLSAPRIAALRQRLASRGPSHLLHQSPISLPYWADLPPSPLDSLSLRDLGDNFVLLDDVLTYVLGAPPAPATKPTTRPFVFVRCACPLCHALTFGPRRFFHAYAAAFCSQMTSIRAVT